MRDVRDGAISSFLKEHFRHFNAFSLVEAADAYRLHVEHGGQMFITLAGAMSTAELGISLAEMIRNRKVHAICCTGANLEEDIFHLLEHEAYEHVPRYRDLTPSDELNLFRRHLNRVTDTCIPEDAIRKVSKAIFAEWQDAERQGERLFPHEFLFRALKHKLDAEFRINVTNSWVHAAMEMDIPIFVPGWEDSSLGNMFTARCLMDEIRSVHTVKTGIEYMMELARWYRRVSEFHSVGFFQIGGGIAGDFAVCVVPMLRQDMGMEQVPLWGYYCQISDSTTSFGSYSGAPPNEKITWGKLDDTTPKFVIESDASIVAPLLFALVLQM